MTQREAILYQSIDFLNDILQTAAAELSDMPAPNSMRYAPSNLNLPGLLMMGEEGDCAFSHDAQHAADSGIRVCRAGPGRIGRRLWRLQFQKSVRSQAN
jgi:hypothetical protein